MGEYVLEVNNITKVFPGVVANDNVSLNVKPGEIMGLIGENGAGKSTILKIINGIYPAGSYEGEIKIDGEVVHPASPVDAVHLGIGFVPQEVSVFRFESVPENIYMGDLTLGKKTFWVNQRELRRHALDLINELQLEIDVDMDLTVMYGIPAAKIASDVQQAVMDSLTNYTGLTVGAVNVHICGITFPKTEEKKS